MDGIVFYSNVNLGDIHLGRSYVRWFRDNYDLPISYTHNQPKEVLADIEGIGWIPNECYALDRNGLSIPKNNKLYCNTWIGAGFTALGVNFTAIHHVFSQHVEALRAQGIEPKGPLPKMPPKIDFTSDHLHIAEVDAWKYHLTDRKRVLIANNFVQSNQAHNFNMNDLIVQLSNERPEIDFYLTNQVEPLLSLPNVFYAERIINSPRPFNLNEIAYFSTFCDTIIGRGSGPFSFCEIEENLDKTWISLTHSHLAPDVFNGLHTFPNKGRYIHNPDPSIILTII